MILPAVTRSREQKTNRDIVAFSDQIAEQKAQISALQTELESFRSTSQETENAQATASATQESYEIVMNIQSHFYAGDMGNQSMAEELLKVNVDSSEQPGGKPMTKWQRRCSRRFAEVCTQPRRKAMTWANYETAISNLEQVLQMDEDYNDGGAMLLLALSYQGSGDQDQANVYYQRIIEDYADTDAAASAQEELDAQNGGGKADDSGEEDTDQKKEEADQETNGGNEE